MRITPMDIRQQQFTVKMFRGFDTQEVDTFLEDLASDYEALLKENSILKEQLQALEERGNLAEVANRGRRGLVLCGGAVGEQEDHLGAAAAAETDAVAVDEWTLADLLAIDVGAVTGVLVANQELVVLRVDFGVVA